MRNRVYIPTTCLAAGMMAVSAGGGPLEVDAAYPLADVTEMPHLNFIRFRGIGDSLLEEEEEEEEPYFDASMSSTYTAYLGKTATLTCVVHAARSDKSVSANAEYCFLFRAIAV